MLDYKLFSEQIIKANVDAIDPSGEVIASVENESTSPQRSAPLSIFNALFICSSSLKSIKLWNIKHETNSLLRMMDGSNGQRMRILLVNHGTVYEWGGGDGVQIRETGKRLQQRGLRSGWCHADQPTAGIRSSARLQSPKQGKILPSTNGQLQGR